MRRGVVAVTGWVVGLAVACGGGGDDGGGVDAAADAPDGAITCVDEADCAGSVDDPCRIARCEEGRCVAAARSDGSACDSGDACYVDEVCDGGVCAGGRKAPAACGERSCGHDACGNVCGHCPEGQICSAAGNCKFDPERCGPIDATGCCTADGRVAWCQDERLYMLECGGAAGIGPACGWLASESFYWCVGEEVAAPDEADAPWLCPGETCGEEPCADRECGVRCGVSCGTCEADGAWCDADGRCQPSECGPITFEGCCRPDGTSVWCEDGRLRERDCPSRRRGGDTCGWIDAEGYYFCADHEVGSGDAELPWLCPDAACGEDPCAERECGHRCGERCGTCAHGERCSDEGRCEAGDCGDVGFEGCCRPDDTAVWCERGRLVGVSCGEGDTKPACGWIDDEGYYFCTRDAAPSGDPETPWLCPGDACGEDPCEGRECGHRCGQPCGECPSEDDLCTAEGTCKPNTCGELTFTGCCDGDRSVYCADNEVRVDDCAAHGYGCGWSDEHGWYDCGFEGEDPSGERPRACEAYDYPR